MSKRIFVTGCGIITSIGNNLEENLNSLTSGRPGIGKIRLLETAHRDTLPAGEIKLRDEELARMLGIELRDGLTRTALLGMLAQKKHGEMQDAGCRMEEGRG